MLNISIFLLLSPYNVSIKRVFSLFSLLIPCLGVLSLYVS